MSDPVRIVAHDLNNVFAAILGCADLLEIRLKENGAALEEAREIQRAAERGAALTRRLLTLTPRSVDSKRDSPQRDRSRTGSRKKRRS